MGTELVVASAQEVVKKMLTDGLGSIDKAAIARQQRLHDENIERLIREHYEKIAEKILTKLWKRCGKMTKHDQLVPFGDECKICGAPLKQRKMVDDEGAMRKIRAFAEELRFADRAAGIEFIPRA